MGRFLTLDIGAGTMDVLVVDEDCKEHFKAVVKAPVRLLAEEVGACSGNIVVTGVEMGGGPFSTVLKERARKSEVAMTASAAATVHHDLNRVRSSGIRIVSEEEARSLAGREDWNEFVSEDIERGRIRRIIESFGVPFQFDVVGVCAQDHGVPPPGHSHLDYRHHIFKNVLDENPIPGALLYEGGELPETLNRLRSIAQTASSLPAREVFVMDSGAAAILGASLDPRAEGLRNIGILDIATSHTIGALLSGGEVAGFFEYHTRDMTLARMEALFEELAEGTLEHKRILSEGGHGAYVRKTLGKEAVQIILTVGPKRSMVKGSSLPVQYGAPWGDNMLTGAVGVLEAVRRRKRLEPFAVG